MSYHSPIARSPYNDPPHRIPDLNIWVNDDIFPPHPEPDPRQRIADLHLETVAFLTNSIRLKVLSKELPDKAEQGRLFQQADESIKRFIDGCGTPHPVNPLGPHFLCPRCPPPGLWKVRWLYGVAAELVSDAHSLQPGGLRDETLRVAALVAQQGLAGCQY